MRVGAAALLDGEPASRLQDAGGFVQDFFESALDVADSDDLDQVDAAVRQARFCRIREGCPDVGQAFAGYLLLDAVDGEAIDVERVHKPLVANYAGGEISKWRQVRRAFPPCA